MRLIAPNGSTVSVDDEKAKRLLSQGYKKAPSKTAKAPANKAASEKSED